MKTLPSRVWCAIAVLMGLPLYAATAAPSRDEVLAAMLRATNFFSEQVAVSGGYVYYVSPDFSRRLGEGVAEATEIWVQPPGTPRIGEAYLTAWEATGNLFYRDAALAAGQALLYGQLESGGWRNSINFNPSGERLDLYRNDQGSKKGKNFTTLDDDITQSALSFLIRLDAALSFRDSKIHDAVTYALPRLYAAQYANGAFPQGWTGPVPAQPVVAAAYPTYDWRTEGRIKEYWNQYTLNDGLVGTVTRTLRRAHDAYDDPEALAALVKLGDFLVLAQMPDPQPAWAQQYGPEMHPIWARAFEPPAVSGRESEDAMITLIRLAECTKNPDLLKPVPSGVKYLEASLLPDGQLARYYELENNKPLYMQRNGQGYELTNDDSNLPDHYGWKNPHQLELIKTAYRAVAAGQSLEPVFAASRPDPDEVARIVAALDGEGRWLTTSDGDPERLVGQPKFAVGETYISSALFADHLEYLSAYVQRSENP
jgi:PelA/Pel-15E family pectate lyase